MKAPKFLKYLPLLVLPFTSCSEDPSLNVEPESVKYEHVSSANLLNHSNSDFRQAKNFEKIANSNYNSDTHVSDEKNWKKSADVAAKGIEKLITIVDRFEHSGNIHPLQMPNLKKNTLFSSVSLKDQEMDPMVQVYGNNLSLTLKYVPNRLDIDSFDVRTAKIDVDNYHFSKGNEQVFDAIVKTYDASNELIDSVYHKDLNTTKGDIKFSELLSNK